MGSNWFGAIILGQYSGHASAIPVLIFARRIQAALARRSRAATVTSPARGVQVAPTARKLQED